MSSHEGLRWRQRALKPIQTSTANMHAAYRVEEEEEEPLSPSARMFHEPNFNVYIVAIMGCKSRIYPDVVKANLGHTLLKHPRFSSLQVEDGNGKLKWVRTEVDLEKHVIVPDLDPARLEFPDKWVEDYISDLSRTTIDRSKQPMWDLHLLNVKTSAAEATGVFRIHHSLGDGTSLMSLVLACTRQVANPEALPTIPVKKKKQQQPVGGYGVGRIWRWIIVLWWIARLIYHTAEDVLKFMATAVFLQDTETPLKASPGVEHRPRRFVYQTVSLDDYKSVKNAMNAVITWLRSVLSAMHPLLSLWSCFNAGLGRPTVVLTARRSTEERPTYCSWFHIISLIRLLLLLQTVNDVCLGITQAGLSRYLNRIYGEMKRSNGVEEVENNLPKNIRLRSTLLINLRPAAGIQALADMMEKDTEAKWGNWIGYVLLPIDIALHQDPLEYIRRTKATIDRKKHSLEAIYTFSIAEIVLKIFGIKRASSLSQRIITRTTMCFSNLVEPIEEIGFYGHHLDFLAPGCYGQPHGLMINFQSYANKMTLVISADEETIPDPHQLCQDIIKSLGLVKDAIKEQRVH